MPASLIRSPARSSRKKRLVGVLCLGGALLAIGLGVAGLAQAGDPEVAVTPVPLSGLCGDKSAVLPRDVAGRLAVSAWYAKPADGAGPPARSPVIFFNAGWGGRVEGHMNQIDALVQRGYVVIGIDQKGSEAYREFVDFSDEAAFTRTRAAVDLKAGEFAKDNSVVLDILQAAVSCADDHNVASVLKRLDFERVGIVGYSFGGAVAAETSRQDSRFKAAVNLDGWLFGDVGRLGLKRPFLEISDDSGLPTTADLNSSDTVHRLTSRLTDGDYKQVLANMDRYGGYFLVMVGSRHQSFVDVSQRSFLAQMASLLPSGRRTIEAVNIYAGAFLDRYVAGASSDLSKLIASPDDGVRVVFAKSPLQEATQ